MRYRPLLLLCAVSLAGARAGAGRAGSEEASVHEPRETVVVVAERAPVELGGTVIGQVAHGRWFGVRERQPGRVGIQFFSGKMMRIGWVDAEHVVRVEDSDVDLADQALEVAARLRPQLDVGAYRARIEALADRVAGAAARGKSPLAKAKLIRRQLFGREGFRYDPTPRTIDSVLDDRRGNCLGLSVLYLCAAQKADMAFRMLAVPGHVLLGYDDGRQRFHVEPSMMGLIFRGGVGRRLGPKGGIYPRVLSHPQAIAVMLSDLGALLGAQERYEEARDAFVRALEVDPQNAEAYFNWGLTLSVRERYGLACAKFSKALHIYPRFAKAYGAWGSALARMGELEWACEKFRSAVQLAPRSATAYYNWGATLLLLGKRREAEARFARALALRPGLKPVVEQMRAESPTRQPTILVDPWHLEPDEEGRLRIEIETPPR
ncbi:MAG: tetratricopeptide repeat protein [Candidatus Brocadiia bacterium]